MKQLKIEEELTPKKDLIKTCLSKIKVLRLKLKLWNLNRQISKYNKGAKVKTVDRLTGIKNDLINTLDADKTVCLLVTVPDISVRDYFLADPLFRNFYSPRVSFREKRLKQNKSLLCLIERI